MKKQQTLRAWRLACRWLWRACECIRTVDESLCLMDHRMAPAFIQVPRIYVTRYKANVAASVAAALSHYMQSEHITWRHGCRSRANGMMHRVE